MEMPPGLYMHADKRTCIHFLRIVKMSLEIDICLFMIHSERAIFSCLVEAESHSVRVEVVLQADCLSVRITADTNRLLMLLLKLVSVKPRSSNLSLSPMIY